MTSKTFALALLAAAVAVAAFPLHIRRVENVGGKLQNVEFESTPDGRDPGEP